MSFTRAFTTKALPLARSRAFATSPHVRKSATEQAKETVHKVNRAVSDELVKGIEKGRMSYPSICFLMSMFQPLETARSES